jgi:hypothetical protein
MNVQELRRIADILRHSGGPTWSGAIELANRLEAALAAPSVKDIGDRASDEEETYQIGYRDGYERGIQDADVRTGGDGEYFASTIPGRGCPDPQTMLKRLSERHDALSALSEASTASGNLKSPKETRDEVIEKALSDMDDALEPTVPMIVADQKAFNNAALRLFRALKSSPVSADIGGEQ